MKEVWIKKTVYRRYLVLDSEIDEVKNILEYGSGNISELIEDVYDKNKDVEYDGERAVLPIEYSISDV